MWWSPHQKQSEQKSEAHCSFSCSNLASTVWIQMDSFICKNHLLHRTATLEKHQIVRFYYCLLNSYSTVYSPRSRNHQQLGIRRTTRTAQILVPFPWTLFAAPPCCSFFPVFEAEEELVASQQSKYSGIHQFPQKPNLEKKGLKILTRLKQEAESAQTSILVNRFRFSWSPTAD